MYNKKEEKKDEETGSSGNPFARIQKTSALQEARAFNETPVNAKKCSLILTKILYLLNHGEVLSTQEATDAFFNMTKLFQSKDATLRRLVYLGIKDLSRLAENVYVVTSSLTQDMNSRDDLCRPSAMRALIQITDATTFQGIERYMKQAIVDKNPSLSSAALVSSLHLSKSFPDGIRRWSNEAQEAVNSDHPMVQQHALGLLYHIRKTDRLAITKLVTKYIRSGLKSPLAICFLIRIAAKLVQEDEARTDSVYYDFIASCLRHKSEMVVYEAANAIVNLNCTSAKELGAAVSVLQLFLSSSKPTLRFAAVRTLNKVAIEHPNSVMACNVDLENLITDTNRSIATLAITTLLMTGSEAGVERLLKQIETFMGEISDEFKIVVVSATRQLCSKFPKKHNVLMSFLSRMLREDGGYEYKKSIVETIINIIGDDPEAKEAGLSHLCEFIEDCEHIKLAVRILHLLGQEGPRTQRPSKYIRYIYNRLILENVKIRAAAVSSLSKFGAQCDDLLPNIIVLLERSTLDSDDEVRDRSVYYLNILKTKQRSLYLNCILNPLQVSLVGLEKSLQQYLSSESNTSQPFDIRSVPIAAQPVIEEKTKKMTNGLSSSVESDKSKPRDNEKILSSRQDIYSQQLASVPQLRASDLGPLLKSSAPIDLTESETEYVVRCIKHTFKNHVVLQFDITNTCNDQILENVSVSYQAPAGFEEVISVPCPRLVYNCASSCYSCLQMVVDETDEELDYTPLLGTLESVNLNFRVKDCDPNTQEVDEDEVGYEDGYALEDIDIVLSDYIQKIVKPDFSSSWNELGEDSEAEEVYQLSSFTSIDDAVKNVVTFLGMQPCDRSDRVSATSDGRKLPSHTLYLSGIFRGAIEVLVRSKLAINLNDPEAGVTMQISVRSGDPTVSSFIAASVA